MVQAPGDRSRVSDGVPRRPTRPTQLQAMVAGIAVGVALGLLFALSYTPTIDSGGDVRVTVTDSEVGPPALTQPQEGLATLVAHPRGFVAGLRPEREPLDRGWTRIQ